jgi:hypothetical protein
VGTPRRPATASSAVRRIGRPAGRVDRCRQGATGEALARGRVRRTSAGVISHTFGSRQHRGISARMAPGDLRASCGPCGRRPLRRDEIARPAVNDRLRSGAGLSGAAADRGPANRHAHSYWRRS